MPITVVLRVAIAVVLVVEVAYTEAILVFASISSPYNKLISSSIVAIRVSIVATSASKAANPPVVTTLPPASIIEVPNSSN